jgi:hypothetical protein
VAEIVTDFPALPCAPDKAIPGPPPGTRAALAAPEGGAVTDCRTTSSITSQPAKNKAKAAIEAHPKHFLSRR